MDSTHTPERAGGRGMCAVGARHNNTKQEKTRKAPKKILNNERSDRVWVQTKPLVSL